MQVSLFDGSKQFKIDKPIRLIELFAGYGSQHFALEYLGVEFESWKICEWAVKSIQAYKDAHFKDDGKDYSQGILKEDIIQYLFDKHISMNYNESMTYNQIKRLGEAKQRTIYNNIQSTNNLVDIQQVKGKDLDVVDTDKYCYIMTYSFPCQDLSSAGLGKGMEKGSGTRSGMLWEVERILDELKNENKELPQVLLMENVPEVIGNNNIKHFAKWLQRLEEFGYKSKYQCLSSIDYKVPQTRDRCFMVSVLGDYYYNFPKEQKLELRLRDLLEKEVDEKYYLSDKQLSYIIDLEDVAFKSGRDIGKSKINPKVAKTISCRGATEQRADVTNFVVDDIEEEISVKELKEILKPKLLGGIGERKSNGGTQWYQQDRIFDDSIAMALTTVCNPYYRDNLRIRKLTPKECFRLMGVKDQDFEKIAQNQSNASLYHLAGDSIVVDVLMAIFKELL